MSDFSIERIEQITNEVVEAALRLVPRLASSNQVDITAEYLERIVGNPDNWWLMARRDSDAKLIGMASLVIMPMPTNVRACLENVVVDNESEGSGVGTALCLRAKEIADENGVNTLRAATSQANLTSARMLEKAGFVRDEQLDYFELSIHPGSRLQD